jgi:AraC-like DNA-binding protein
MHTSPLFIQGRPDDAQSICDADLLPCHPIFRTHDLEHAREHLTGVFTDHSLAYLTRERRLDFRHRQAKLGAVAINSIRFGVGVAIKTPAFSDFYLVQITLSGGCRLSQGRSCIDTPAGSIAVINPFRPFAMTVFPGTLRLMLRVDRLLVEREFQAWTGSDLTKRIEFDQPQMLTREKVDTLTRYVRMLCDDLKSSSSALEHPLVRDRIASALVSTLLVSMPHNMQRELEPAARSIAPFFVRRVEHFMEENARQTINLEDLAGVAGVSARALQLAFRRFRETTPMAYLRVLRLELARRELAQAARNGGCVASVANACGFEHLSRFAAEYKARFNESPAQTLRRGTIGRSS